MGIWLMEVAFFSRPSSVPLSVLWRGSWKRARTHLGDELGAHSTDVIIGEVELGGHALGLSKKGHLVGARDGWMGEEGMRDLAHAGREMG